MDEDGKRDVEILAVSVDDVPLLQRMVDQISKDGLRVDYAFLSDPDRAVISRYGILNPEDRRRIPHPTTLVIDMQGVVRWKFIEVNYKVRPTNAMILEALRRVDASK